MLIRILCVCAAVVAISATGWSQQVSEELARLPYDSTTHPEVPCEQWSFFSDPETVDSAGWVCVNASSHSAMTWARSGSTRLFSAYTERADLLSWMMMVDTLTSASDNDCTISVNTTAYSAVCGDSMLSFSFDSGRQSISMVFINSTDPEQIRRVGMVVTATHESL